MQRKAVLWSLLAFLSAVAAAGAQAQKPSDEDPKARELPDGDGKKILTAACVACHGLEEVTKFKGFYTRSEWRDIVDTMVKYGAELKEGEADILADYLGRYLGKQAQ
jgi:mono/diheme cytochrome c family protein